MYYLFYTKCVQKIHLQYFLRIKAQLWHMRNCCICGKLLLIFNCAALSAPLFEKCLIKWPFLICVSNLNWSKINGNEVILALQFTTESRWTNLGVNLFKVGMRKCSKFSWLLWGDLWEIPGWFDCKSDRCCYWLMEEQGPPPVEGVVCLPETDCCGLEEGKMTWVLTH